MKLVNATTFKEELVKQNICDDSYIEEWVCNFIDELPGVEAIPKEKVDQALAKIKAVANSGQFNASVCFGLTHAIFIFKMATMEEDCE